VRSGEGERRCAERLTFKSCRALFMAASCCICLIMAALGSAELLMDLMSIVRVEEVVGGEWRACRRVIGKKWCFGSGILESDCQT